MARFKKKKPWSNFGDGIQAYDVCFEVDKLDHLKSTDGKDSEKYKKQHSKAIKLINSFNAEGGVSLNLGKCRSIIQGPRHFSDTVFYNEGKKVASNKKELENG